jgi:plasmid stabilization system protein ParE
MSKNPVAAQRAAKRIIEGIMILKDHSGAGTPVEDLADYRDLTLPFGSGDYIIRYREEPKRVTIVRVRYSKKQTHPLNNDFKKPRAQKLFYSLLKDKKTLEYRSRIVQTIV